MRESLRDKSALRPRRQPVRHVAFGALFNTGDFDPMAARVFHSAADDDERVFGKINLVDLEPFGEVGQQRLWRNGGGQRSCGLARRA